jgi:osmotically inducible protein OsmC
LLRRFKSRKDCPHLKKKATSPTKPEVVRRGTVSWLTHPPAGPARIEAESNAFGALPVSMPEHDPIPHEATPGELLALTQAMFLASALSEALVSTGSPANELVVHAECTFAGTLDDRELTAVDIHVRGRVPGIDADRFRKAVEEAWSKALRSAAMQSNLRGQLRVELASS